jgi:hypothetical protein
MIRYMVWIILEIGEGWGCTRCDWVIAAPPLESTVAALQYNRTAQKIFDAHDCGQNGRAADTRRELPPEGLVPQQT